MSINYYLLISHIDMRPYLSPETHIEFLHINFMIGDLWAYYKIANYFPFYFRLHIQIVVSYEADSKTSLWSISSWLTVASCPIISLQILLSFYHKHILESIPLLTILLSLSILQSDTQSVWPYFLLYNSLLYTPFNYE